MASNVSEPEEQQMAMVAESTVSVTLPLVSQPDTASVEAQDEPVVSAASLLFYRRPMQRSVGSLYRDFALGSAIYSAWTTTPPSILGGLDIPRPKHSRQSSRFSWSTRLPIQYRIAESITTSLEDDPLDVLSLLQLKLPLSI